MLKRLLFEAPAFALGGVIAFAGAVLMALGFVAGALVGAVVYGGQVGWNMMRAMLAGVLEPRS